MDFQDSFTHLLADRLRRVAGIHIRILPESQAQNAALREFDALVLSPGPGLPQEHPAGFRLLQALPPGMPVLGVCMGMQMLGMHHGARLRHLDAPRHGMAAEFPCAPCRLHPGGTLRVGLYHSWALDAATLPPCLRLCAADAEGVPMLIEHRERPAFGVQFHPESILSPDGDALLAAFAAAAGG